MWVGNPICPARDGDHHRCTLLADHLLNHECPCGHHWAD